MKLSAEQTKEKKKGKLSNKEKRFNPEKNSIPRTIIRNS